MILFEESFSTVLSEESSKIIQSFVLYKLEVNEVNDNLF